MHGGTEGVEGRGRRGGGAEEAWWEAGRRATTGAGDVLHGQLDSFKGKYGSHVRLVLAASKPQRRQRQFEQRPRHTRPGSTTGHAGCDLPQGTLTGGRGRSQQSSGSGSISSVLVPSRWPRLPLLLHSLSSVVGQLLTSRANRHLTASSSFSGSSFARTFLLPCVTVSTGAHVPLGSSSCASFSSDSDLPNGSNTWDMILDLSFHCKVSGILRVFVGRNGATAILGTCQFSMLLAPVRRALEERLRVVRWEEDFFERLAGRSLDDGNVGLCATVNVRPPPPRGGWAPFSLRNSLFHLWDPGRGEFVLVTGCVCRLESVSLFSLLFFLLVSSPQPLSLEVLVRRPLDKTCVQGGHSLHGRPTTSVTLKALEHVVADYKQGNSSTRSAGSRTGRVSRRA